MNGMTWPHAIVSCVGMVSIAWIRSSAQSHAIDGELAIGSLAAIVAIAIPGALGVILQSLATFKGK